LEIIIQLLRLQKISLEETFMRLFSIILVAFRQFPDSISPDLDAEETDCQNMVQNLVLMYVSDFFLA